MHGKQWAISFVAVGLVACGGEDARVYDVEFDAAALSDVPTRCTGTYGVGPRQASGLAARQRWTIRKGEFSSLTLELPDVGFTLSHVDSFFIDTDDAPDVMMGTSSEEGPFQFVDMRTEAPFDLPIRRVLRLFIANDGLGDTLQGFVWLRSEYGPGISEFDEEQCISTIPFTGRRVEE